MLLYLILPPIAIIVSLVVLVAFVSRKVRTLPPDGIRDSSNESRVESASGDNHRMDKLKKRSLIFLEKFLHSFKIIFLRFHNRFDSLFRIIKEKRQSMKAGEAVRGSFDASEDDRNALNHEEGDEIKERAERNQMARFPYFSKIKKISREETMERPDVSKEIEKPIRPMLSEEIVAPDAKVDIKTEIKSKLEELLIERIASDPRDIEAYERLGDYYMERNIYKDARECFRQVLKLSPANRRAKMKMKRLERILG